MAESTLNLGDTEPIDRLNLPRDGADGRFFGLVLIQRVVLEDLGLNLTRSLRDPLATCEEVDSLYKEMAGRPTNSSTVTTNR